ncbi:MAG: ABC transporter ATP-binding protein/permease [Chloroflexi bacterium]|nr:ABC transporter ATP-binding protein/permease [Chloroflexota bacterium]
MLKADGLLTPTAQIHALALAAIGLVAEALLLRGLFDLGRDLGLAEQRLGAMGACILFVVALLLVEIPIAQGLLRAGRRLESRMRASFLRKIPRLGDKYFRSRLTSDMAERSHVIQGLRLLPDMGGRLIRSIFELTLTAIGIYWLDPRSAPLSFLAAALAVGVPLLFHPSLSELDLRVRTHAGALSRYYLDALLGLVAIRAHAAYRTVRREHEGLLVEWSRASLARQRLAVALEGVQSFTGFALAAWLVLDHLARESEAGSVLLLVYWAFNLPVLGQEIALFARQYPAFRNMTTRLLEPLGAPEESRGAGEQGSRGAEVQKNEEVEERQGKGTEEQKSTPAPLLPRTPAQPGVAINFDDVSARAAGHTILEGIDLAIEAGSHIAILGPSGAGKSSLVGTLLGWHRPASGRVLFDGQPLDGDRINALRKQTAWVDPAVHLWNRSLLENLRYGDSAGPSVPIGQIIEEADLRGVLEKLPDGLQTPLGEGGALVSGGEGQRVRLGRAMLRRGARLVILDEPFRGIEREQRRSLLARARSLWQGATLLCITHDVAETMAFERVVVMEGGKIVEDSPPLSLAESEGSRYRAMLNAERRVQEELRSAVSWRRLRVEDGRVAEGSRQ